jgi:D-alanine-D-alanine ligase
MKSYAKLAFEGLKLKDLARIDFFIDSENQVYLNEINTFPGHTSISMFPMMLEANGHLYSDFLKSLILNNARKR